MLILSPTAASSASKVASAFFEAGRDSPLSRASSTSRFVLSQSRRSAGTLTPVFNMTMSPTTRVSDLMISILELRITCEESAARLRRDCIVFSARKSWINLGSVNFVQQTRRQRARDGNLPKNYVKEDDGGDHGSFDEV